jgi:hypothetical protein
MTVTSGVMNGQLHLRGNRSWYLAKSLHWLPTISVDGSRPVIRIWKVAPGASGDDVLPVKPNV